MRSGSAARRARTSSSVRALFEERFSCRGDRDARVAAGQTARVIELSRGRTGDEQLRPAARPRRGAARSSHAALDAGVTHLDTADIYGGGDSERFIGSQSRSPVAGSARLLRRSSAWARSAPGGAPERIRGALEGSLERLGMDYVDILYYHRPDGLLPSPRRSARCTRWSTSGRSARLGVSNVHARAVARSGCDGAGRRRAEPLQPAEARHRLSWTYCPSPVELDVGFVPYFPLASGLLTGKYKRGRRQLLRVAARRVRGIDEESV